MRTKTLDFFTRLTFLWAALYIVLIFVFKRFWFEEGDFTYLQAIAYHGITVTLWMILLLGFWKKFLFEHFPRILPIIGAGIPIVFVTVGGFFVKKFGFNYAVALFTFGLVSADVFAIYTIFALIFRYRDFQEKVNKWAFWTAFLGLIAVSLATPLGHLVGFFKDFGTNNLLAKIFGIHSNQAIDNLLDSHSHQVLGSILISIFSFYLIDYKWNKGVYDILAKIGFVFVLAGLIAEVGIYQFTAWTGLDLPVLWKNGLSGVPLDDFVLSWIGLGFLMWLPLMFRLAVDEKDMKLLIGASIISAYLVSVIALGLFIEFNETFFGQGQFNTPGVANDLAFVKAHLLFGFFVLPLLASVCLHFNPKCRLSSMGLISVFVVLALGLIGVYLWVFALNAILEKITFGFLVLTLFLSFLCIENQKEEI